MKKYKSILKCVNIICNFKMNMTNKTITETKFKERKNNLHKILKLLTAKKQIMKTKKRIIIFLAKYLITMGKNNIRKLFEFQYTPLSMLVNGLLPS